ncbi:MAG: ribonuclease P protein component [Thermotogae bacterium]|nr:ribonuclease P protein component [Thermotogota bacterium]
MSEFSFERNERLKLRRDFERLFEKDNRVINDFFVIVYCKNGLDHSRIGISVKRKFGNSPERNRLKRYLREIYRNNKTLFPVGIDYLFIPRKSLSKIFDKLELSDIKKMVLDLMGQLKI